MDTNDVSVPVFKQKRLFLTPKRFRLKTPKTTVNDDGTPTNRQIKKHAMAMKRRQKIKDRKIKVIPKQYMSQLYQ